MKNYYAILQVPVGSDVSEIREAYRRLAQEYVADPVAFAELKEAYEVLATPLRRAEYDKTTFGSITSNSTTMTTESTIVMAGSIAFSGAPKQCPMGAAAQCPVINAHVPLGDTYCPECGVLLASLPAEGFDLTTLAAEELLPSLVEQNGRRHRLRRGLNSVGREGTDVILADKTVSRHHAQIEVTAENAVFIEDKGSTNGTRIGAVMLEPDVPLPLAPGETVRFGSVMLSLDVPGAENTALPFAAQPLSAAIEPAVLTAVTPVARLISVRGTSVPEYALVPGVTTFGRRADNSIVLTGDPYVSGHHAQIIAEDGAFRLTDVGSTNGTQVNGEKIAPDKPVLLHDSDEIMIGSAAYRFEQLYAEPETQPETQAEIENQEGRNSDAGNVETEQAPPKDEHPDARTDGDGHDATN